MQTFASHPFGDHRQKKLDSYRSVGYTPKRVYIGAAELARKKGRAARTVTLKIPQELYDNLSRLIEGTGFRSVTEFAVHVLRDIAAGGKLKQSDSGFTAREVEIIRERLRSLGYLE